MLCYANYSCLDESTVVVALILDFVCRIHTTYHQVGIATGRLASSNPNMQAVPAHDERGRMFRAAFTADKGHLLLAADYSQVRHNARARNNMCSCGGMNGAVMNGKADTSGMQEPGVLCAAR